MKITEEQLELAVEAYFSRNIDGIPAGVQAAIATLPEPAAMLRPLSEMPREVPEGCIVIYGFFFQDGWRTGSQRGTQDSHLVFVKPPTPEDEEWKNFEAWWHSQKRKESQGQGSFEDCFLAWQAGRAAK